MASTTLMMGLLAVYAIIAVVSAFEANYPRCLYWVGAGVITFAVLWGTK